jgi:hypothetical protein
MRKQLNYTCMLKNLLKLYCIWTWNTLWGFFCFVLCSFVLFYFSPLRDNYRTTSEAPSPGLQAEGWTTKLLRIKLHWIWTWRISFIFILFIYSFSTPHFSFCFILYTFFSFHLPIFYFYSYLNSSSFYFQSSLCLSNAFSGYGWLVHCISLFISLKLFLFLSLFCFFSTCLFVFPVSFNFFAFLPLSPFHSKYH